MNSDRPKGPQPDWRREWVGDGAANLRWVRELNGCKLEVGRRRIPTTFMKGYYRWEYTYSVSSGGRGDAGVKPSIGEAQSIAESIARSYPGPSRAAAPRYCSTVSAVTWTKPAPQEIPALSEHVDSLKGIFDVATPDGSSKGVAVVTRRAAAAHLRYKWQWRVTSTAGAFEGVMVSRRGAVVMVEAVVKRLPAWLMTQHQINAKHPASEEGQRELSNQLKIEEISVACAILVGFKPHWNSYRGWHYPKNASRGPDRCGEAVVELLLAMNRIDGRVV